MAIDRGPWNALIDDDGSNLVGTIWNKDKIKTTILDPVDAALIAAPVAIPFNAGMFACDNPSGAIWTVTAGAVYAHRYIVLGGRVVFYMLTLAQTAIQYDIPNTLVIQNLPFQPKQQTVRIRTSRALSAGSTMVEAYIQPSILTANRIDIARLDGAKWNDPLGGLDFAVWLELA